MAGQKRDNRSGSKDAHGARAERLATALKANLKRRKAQAKGRAQIGAPDDPSPSAAADDRQTTNDEETG